MVKSYLSLVGFCFSLPFLMMGCDQYGNGLVSLERSTHVHDPDYREVTVTFFLTIQRTVVSKEGLTLDLTIDPRDKHVYCVADGVCAHVDEVAWNDSTDIQFIIETFGENSSTKNSPYLSSRYTSMQTTRIGDAMSIFIPTEQLNRLGVNAETPRLHLVVRIGDKWGMTESNAIDRGIESTK